MCIKFNQVVTETDGVNSIAVSCLTFVSWFSIGIGKGDGDNDGLTRFTCEDFFDDDDRDEDELDEWEPGDVRVFGLILVDSSLNFGDVCSVLVTFNLDTLSLFEDDDDELIEASVAAAALSLSRFWCCCANRNEFRSCSLWSKAAAITDELSALLNRLDEALGRKCVGSKFGGKKLFVPAGRPTSDA